MNDEMPVDDIPVRKTRYEGKRHLAREMGLEKKTKAELTRVANEKKAEREAIVKAKADLKEKKSEAISQAMKNVAGLIDEHRVEMEEMDTGDSEEISRLRRRRVRAAGPYGPGAYRKGGALRFPS